MQDDTLNASPASRQLTEKVRSVGEISQDGLLYILKEEKNGWLYVESGKVRGFVKESELYTGDEVASVKNYINQHYAEDLSLETLAEKVYLSSG